MNHPLSKSLHRKELEKYLKRFLPELRGKILDIGSKNRRYDYLLKTKPVAIDLVANKEKEIIHGDINNLSFPSENFDAVICLEVLEYVKDPKIAINEIYRVLKPGGGLILSVPFMMKIHEDMGRYTEKYLREILSDFKDLQVYKIGNFYSIILDILRQRIYSLNVWLFKIILLVIYLFLLLFLPLVSLFKDPNFVSGYLIRGRKII